MFDNVINKSVHAYPYRYAITITLNTHPSKNDGIFNEHTAVALLKKFGIICKMTYELSCTCQLHIHALIISKTNKFIKKIIAKWKKINKKYSVKVDRLTTDADVNYWSLYLQKSFSMQHHYRELYYRLVRYYHQKDAIDLGQLADLDVEVINNRFRFISPDKVRFTC